MAIVINILFGILGICLAVYAYNESCDYPVLTGVAVMVVWILLQIGANYMFA